MKPRHKLRHVISRRKSDLKQVLPSNAPVLSDSVPRITNETVQAHREEVIGKARKYKYPLQHSKHKIVLISTALFIAGAVAFFAYCTIALYKLQSTSTFIYRVTQVVPFPIARADGRFVAYENYLFELRHYTHYYENHAKEDFTRQQLDAFKKQALDKVVADAYVKEMAEEHKISISDREVNDQMAIMRSQNRLGTSDKVLEDVLKDYWGWSIDDFKRSLRTQLLAQKVASKLDTDSQRKAEAALAELKNGADFAAVAQKYSDDADKANGGEFGVPISRSMRDLPPQITDAIYRLQPGKFSDIVNTGYTLEIVKNIEPSGDKIRAAHISIKIKDISQFVNERREKRQARLYINP